MRWKSCALAIATLCVGWPAQAQVVVAGARSGVSLTGGAPETPTPISIGEGTGAITGAVVDAAGKPIPGAIVSITGTVARGAAPLRGIRQIADEHGRFAFTQLPGGSYVITASKFGYFDGGYGRRGERNPARRITIVDGQWFRDASIPLQRPSAISGTVLDEAGEPLVGVLVRVCAEVLVAGVRQIASGPSTRTDDRGMYRIGNLPPGKYLVMVPSVQHAVPAETTLLELSGTTAQAVASAEAAGRPSPLRRDPALAIDPAHRLIVGPYPMAPPLAGAGRPQAYPITFYPAARTLPDAQAIELGPDEDRQGLTLQLRPVPTFRVTGRVDGPDDAVAGMTLRLLPAGSERLGRGNEAGTALVSADGSFTFLNIPNGSYVLIANRTTSEYAFRPAFSASPEVPYPPGYRMSSMSSSAASSGPAGTSFTNYSSSGNVKYQGRAAVAVDGQDASGVVVTLQAGVTISGRIVYDLSKPRQGSALPLGLLRAEPANGDASLGQPRWMRRSTDPADEFTIEGLLPGDYFLRGLGAVGIQSITWNGADHTYTPFDASTGRDITGVVITFTDRVGTVTGAVRDSAGQMVSEAAVLYFPAERAQWTNYGIQPARMRATTASTTGAFALRTLPAGDYFLIAVDDELIDAWKDPAFLEAASRVATRISIGWNETRTQDLVLQRVR